MKSIIAWKDMENKIFLIKELMNDIVAKTGKILK